MGSLAGTFHGTLKVIGITWRETTSLSEETPLMLGFATTAGFHFAAYRLADGIGDFLCCCRRNCLPKSLHESETVALIPRTLEVCVSIFLLARGVIVELV